MPVFFQATNSQNAPTAVFFLCAKALYLYQKSSLIRTESLTSLSLGKKRESEFEVYKIWGIPKGRGFQSVIMRHPCGTPARRAENNICIIYILEMWLQTRRGIFVLHISNIIFIQNIINCNFFLLNLPEILILAVKT